MSEVRTHLLNAKEEIRLALIGSLEEQYADLVPQLASMYADLTEKLKVVRGQFGNDEEVFEFGGHLYDIPTQYNFNLESNVDLNTGEYKWDTVTSGEVTIDPSNHPDFIVTDGNG
jgi:hypothetical protein|tara:strand:- start:5781 stop:6125 length:345 start_codon:yes stop_codon:yes gene_type:complete